MTKRKLAVSLSPLSLLALAACGGGSSDGVSSAAAIASGNVQNGPLANAWAFLDLNGNGVYDSAVETQVRTEASGGSNSAGYYSISTTATDYTLIAYTDATTIDTTTGSAYGAGVVLKAPMGSTKITPNTTLVESVMTANTGLTAAEASAKIAVAMGLPAGMDVLTYDAYADQSSMTTAQKTEALAVQKANNKIMTVVNTFAAVADGSGMTAAASFDLAMGSMADVVKAKVTAGTALDFVTDMAAIVTDVKADLATYAAANTSLGINTTNFDAVMDEAKNAVDNVVLKVEAFTITTSEADKKAVIETIGSVVNEVKTASVNVKTAGNTTSLATDITSDVLANLETKIGNAAPTDITITQDSSSNAVVSSVGMDGRTSFSFKDGSTVSEIGMAVAVDATASETFTYAISGGADAALFTIASDGKLSFAASTTLSNTTKASYEVGVKVTDTGGAGKSFVEVFNITVAPSAFGLDSHSVTITDYNTAASAAVTNTVLTTTTAGKVTIGNTDAPSAKVDLANLIKIFDGNAATTGTSPVLKFTLDNVPTTSGSGTITATIIEGTDATRTGTENSISLTLNVTYTGNGTVGTITVPTQSATGSYVKGSDGTTVDFTLANGDIDAFSITAANAVTGMPASLDVKMEALYTAFETGAGAGSSASVLTAGTYHVEIATTLPLIDASDATVTSVSANLQLVNLTATDTNTIIGSDRSDTLTGGSSVETIIGGKGDDIISGGAGIDAINGGAGNDVIDGGTGADVISGGAGNDVIDGGAGIDAITTGAGADLVALVVGGGADVVSDFTDGTDLFDLGSIAFASLTVAQGTGSNSAATVISVTTGGEILMHVSDTTYTDITTADFV